MERIVLFGGSDSRRSRVANAQRCVNYFAEINRKDALSEFTLYQRPGFVPLIQGVGSPVRGIFRASNGAGYAIIGPNVYSLAVTPNPVPAIALTKIGTIIGPGANLVTPVSLTDNGIDTLLVDGSSVGWTWDLATNTFAQFNDPTGSFQGADRVDTIDTFVIWNMPGTNLFGSTLSNELTIDPLYVAGKSDYPDPLRTLFVNRHEILLFGDLKSEIWYDAGNAQFPFAELPGAYIEHGIVAKYSVASADIAVYWLGQDLQGSGFVFRQRGYETKRVSNHAVEYAIRKMAEAGTIADAIGYTYQQDGHLFYVLTFPTGNQTWVFDESVGEPTAAWHQRAFTDGNGVLNRDRSNCAAFINGLNLVGDWQNGTIYYLDLDSYVDEDILGNQYPITCIRSLPHLNVAAASPQHLANPAQANGRVIQFSAFYLDMECGDVQPVLGPLPPQVTLRISRDRGKTFETAGLQSAGEPGQYETWPEWRALGRARDMVFEIEHSLAGPAALNGGSFAGTLLVT